MRTFVTICLLFLTVTARAQKTHDVITKVGLGVAAHQFSIPDSVPSFFERPDVYGVRTPVQVMYPMRWLSVGVSFAWTDLHFIELYGSTTKRNLLETGLTASSTINITFMRSQINVYGGIGYARLLNRDKNQPHELTRANGIVFSFGLVPTIYFTNEYRAGIILWLNYSTFNFMNSSTASDFTMSTYHYKSRGASHSAGLGFVYRFRFAEERKSFPNSDPLQ